MWVYGIFRKGLLMASSPRRIADLGAPAHKTKRRPKTARRACGIQPTTLNSNGGGEGAHGGGAALGTTGAPGEGEAAVGFTPCCSAMPRSAAATHTCSGSVSMLA